MSIERPLPAPVKRCPEHSRTKCFALRMSACKFSQYWSFCTNKSTNKFCLLLVNDVAECSNCVSSCESCPGRDYKSQKTTRRQRIPACNALLRSLDPETYILLRVLSEGSIPTVACSFSMSYSLTAELEALSSVLSIFAFSKPQQLRALVLAGNPGLIPSNYMVAHNCS